MTNEQRITLVARHDSSRDYDWNEESSDSIRLAFIDGGPFLHLATSAALNEPTLDTERLIIDRAASAEMFLELLAALPREFGGDVLRIDDHGRGFLSATGRGGDRLLYALGPDDVLFYLYAHGLVRADERDVLEKIA